MESGSRKEVPSLSFIHRLGTPGSYPSRVFRTKVESQWCAVDDWFRSFTRFRTLLHVGGPTQVGVEVSPPLYSVTLELRSTLSTHGYWFLLVGERERRHRLYRIY